MALSHRRRFARPAPGRRAAHARPHVALRHRPGPIGRLVSMGVSAALLVLGLMLSAAIVRAAAPPVHAAYFYNYMNVDHLDSLAAAGFDRAVIHWITDSLGVAGGTQLRAWARRGAATGVEVVPQWALQARQRLAGVGTARRYTWGSGTVEPDVACPLDSLYWRSALLDRAEEALAADTAAKRLAIDLELYSGTRHHYDAGPCRCAWCIAEYAGGVPVDGRDPRRLAGLGAYEEARVAHIVAGLLAEFAARHPSVEFGWFDLDFDSFLHRGVARALARSGVPTVDYCERTYRDAGASAPAARARLDALGLTGTPLIAGLWLRGFAPKDVPPAVAALLSGADGYFVFTTYSLWQDPAKLTGPYVLPAPAHDYWDALRRSNLAP